MPILSRAGFFSLVRDKPDAPQVQALMYGLGLLGAMVSPEHHHLQAPCLHLARRYVELCEQDDDLMISLELFQALLCIIRYELTHRTIQRAWLTVGRAVRLGHILGLHLNNAKAEGSEVHHGLPTTTDAISLEERRRAFWTLYICETYASSRARLPPLLQEDHITVPLPSPGVLTTNFVPCAMATLRETYDARRLADCRISAFAGVILACAMARRCQPHAEAATISGPSSAVSSPPASALSATKASSLPPTRGFWDRQFSLLTLLRHRFELLGPHLTVRAVQTDSVSFALYVYLCGIDIALQEAAVAQAQKQDFSPLIVADSAKRSRAAAYRLVGVAQGMLATTPSGVRFPFTTRTTSGGYSNKIYGEQVEFFTLHGAFIARPLAIAMKVLGRDLTHHEDDIRASSKVAVSLHLLLGALDRTEERDGFWHHMIEPVIRALHEWEDLHGNRPADTWALGLTQGDTTLHLLPPGQSYQSQR
ncbi:hypothetical protein NUW58_g8910 [Xylaria curta]|uniref:Uncharacterized protein n=1 Tax=Xylaria curta TaxID=42375 RepID=A0ACC1N3X6_9PEZI|nr:hypothetical protein NUW58_g8910 [Xylaria curta]